MEIIFKDTNLNIRIKSNFFIDYIYEIKENLFHMKGEKCLKGYFIMILV